MRATLIALGAVTVLTFGCSKKAAPEPEAAAADPEAAAPVAPTQDNAMVAASLEELNRKIEQQQYEAAVGALVTMSQMPKSPAQEAQFTARLRETETALIRKAQQGDPAAQQSVEMLGRMMTGR